MRRLIFASATWLLCLLPGPVLADEIDGLWRGSFFCYPSNQRFALSIARDPAEAPAVSARLASVPIDPSTRPEDARTLSLTGDYDAAAKSATLKPDRRQDDRSARKIEFTVLIDGDRLIGRFADFEAGSCSFLIADRTGAFEMPDDSRPRNLTPAETASLRAEQKTFLAGADLRKSCDRVASWARRLVDEYPPEQRKRFYGIGYSPAYALLGDEEFRAFFGKRYDDLTLADRSNLTGLLRRGGCLAELRKLDGGLAMVVERMFLESGQGGRRQALSGAAGIRALREWRDRARDEVSAMPATADAIERLDGYRRAGEHHLTPLWPSERTEFAALLDATAQRLAPAVAIISAEEATASAAGYDGFLALAGWARDNELLLARLDPEAVRAPVRIVSARIDAILRDLAPAELASIPPPGRDMTALNAGTQWYGSFADRYATALDHASLRDILDRFRSGRDETLSSLAPEIIASMAPMTRVSEVDALLARVLAVPGDRGTEAGKAIVAAAERKRIALDTEIYLSRFSPGERALMQPDGLLRVPVAYPAPSGEEIRLAILREMASLGGTMLNPRTATLAIPPFGAFGFGVQVTLDDAHTLSCEAKDAGYICASAMKMRLRLPDEVRRFFAGSPVHARLVDAVGVLLDTQQEMATTDQFVLTPAGWRSPTAAARRVDGIIATYESMGEAARAVGDAQCASLWGQTNWGQAVCGP